MSAELLPEWDRLLSSAARLQRIVPSAVLVGGTAAALHARHRFSRDADHVLTDLQERFDGILTDLEQAAGWKTARIRRPVMILGSLDGIEATRLDEYKNLAPKWHDWSTVESVAAGIAVLILDHLDD